MATIVEQLKKLVPKVRYQAGDSYYWSPKQSTITYRVDNNEPGADWALLHETAHAILDHKDYHSDLELLLLEVEAWHKAKFLGKELGIEVGEEHIQDCLDTYRDWLHQRSTCPRCSIVSLQISNTEYSCHNCGAHWHVSSSRFCRPYRLSKNTDQIKSRPETSSPATFQ